MVSTQTLTNFLLRNLQNFFSQTFKTSQMLSKIFFRRLQIFFKEACKASALKIVKFLQAFHWYLGHKLLTLGNLLFWSLKTLLYEDFEIGEQTPFKICKALKQKLAAWLAFKLYLSKIKKKLSDLLLVWPKESIMKMYFELLSVLLKDLSLQQCCATSPGLESHKAASTVATWDQILAITSFSAEPHVA